MRVGYLTGVYPRASDTFIQREVSGVRAAGIDVTTMSIRRPGVEHLVGEEQRTEHQQTTYVLPARAASVVRAQAWFARRQPRRWASAVGLAALTRAPGTKSTALQTAYLAEAAVVAQRAIDQRLDHLHNHFGDQSGTVTMLAARLADISFSMTIHGPHLFFEPGRWALGVKAEHAAFVACISDFCRSQVMVFAPQSAWDRLHVVHCGVVPSLFAPRPAPPTGRFRVLVVGRLAPEKGLPVLLNAAAGGSLPGLEIVLVGDGPDRDALARLASELGVPVRFTGSRSQGEVRELLGEADLLVSAGFAEGVPTALMEAMAARVPVVASRVAGVAELVDDGVSGLLVAPGSVGSLATALARMHAMSSAERLAMGDAGRRRVEESFDAVVEAERLASLFRRYASA